MLLSSESYFVIQYVILKVINSLNYIFLLAMYELEYVYSNVSKLSSLCIGNPGHQIYIVCSKGIKK